MCVYVCMCVLYLYAYIHEYIHAFILHKINYVSIQQYIHS